MPFSPRSRILVVIRDRTNPVVGSHARGERYYSRCTEEGRRRARGRAFIIIDTRPSIAAYLSRGATHICSMLHRDSPLTRRRFLMLCAINDESASRTRRGVVNHRAHVPRVCRLRAASGREEISPMRVTTISRVERREFSANSNEPRR